MAEDSQTEPTGSGKTEMAFMPWLMILGVLAIIAAAAGAGVGAALSSMLAPGGPSTAMTQSAEAGKAEMDDGDAKNPESDYQPGNKLVDMPPILTNLHANEAIWVRLEATLVFKQDPKAEGAKQALEIAGDILAFLRGVKLIHLRGASGLHHLKADLLDIAKWRSNGMVQEVILKTLVVD